MEPKRIALAEAKEKLENTQRILNLAKEEIKKVPEFVIFISGVIKTILNLRVVLGKIKKCLIIFLQKVGTAYLFA